MENTSEKKEIIGNMSESWIDSHQLILAALINIFALLIIPVITNSFQSWRDNKRWKINKIYEIYLLAQDALTELVKARAYGVVGEFKQKFYQAKIALTRLSIVCSKNNQVKIVSINNDLSILIKPDGQSTWITPTDEQLYSLLERLNDIFANERSLSELMR